MLFVAITTKYQQQSGRPDPVGGVCATLFVLHLMRLVSLLRLRFSGAGLESMAVRAAVQVCCCLFNSVFGWKYSTLSSSIISPTGVPPPGASRRSSGSRTPGASFASKESGCLMRNVPRWCSVDPSGCCRNVSVHQQSSATLLNVAAVSVGTSPLAQFGDCFTL